MNKSNRQDQNQESTESSPDTPPNVSPNKQASVAKSAGVVSIAVMFSRVLGLVREQVFAFYFGAGFLSDAFQAAFKLSNTLRDLFAEGALSAAFVKTFTEYQVKKGEQEAWRLANLVLNGLAVILSIISIIGVAISPYLVKYLAKNFDPDKAALAATLLQIMFPFILLVGLAAVAMGILNTKGKFGVPASASTAFNIVSIIVGLGFAYFLSDGRMAWGIDSKAVAPDFAQWAIIGMSIGVLIGGGTQFLIQVPSLLKVGFRFKPILSFTDPGVRKVAWLMAPAIIGTSAVQIKVFVDVFFLSGIEGGNTWLPLAFRLMQLPIGLFGVAIGTAAIPTLSRLAAEEKFAEFRNTLSEAMRLVFMLTIPAACGLIVLARPIMSLIFERGKFTPFDTDMSAYALIAYSIGLAGYAAIKVLTPSFYALDDVRTPMIVSLSSILVYIATGYSFMSFFSKVGVTVDNPNGLAHVGLPLATSCIALVSFCFLTFMMRRKIKRLNGRAILSAFVKIAAASAIMSVICYFLNQFLHVQFGGHNLFHKLTEVLIPVVVGGIIFLVVGKLLQINEIEKVYRLFARKLGISKA